MKKIFIIMFAGILLSSCVDTVILPYSKTTDENYWKTKDEVSSVVAKAYLNMTDATFMRNLIVWSDFRSDEFTYTDNITEGLRDALVEMYTQNTQPTNTFTSWGALYTTINYCNIVLEKAEQTLSVDPAYTEGDYQAHRSQVLALRSLCYFYLVRVFRDVPLTAGAYMSNAQEMEIAQSDPNTVLQYCIDGLLEAEPNAMTADAYTGTNAWRNYGYITKDGIWAILADIYLWRASVNHSLEDYKQAIVYCDKVLESKKNQHVKYDWEVEDEANPYNLYDYQDYYSQIFGDQNSEESIFELQYNDNVSLCQMYHKFKNNNSGYGYLKVSGSYGNIGSNNVFIKESDMRLWESIYDANTSADNYDVRKMVSQSGRLGSMTKESRTSRTYSGYSQNWIVYRITDVLLMKAEAMMSAYMLENGFKDGTEIKEGDYTRQQVFNIVQYVNSRSIPTTNLADDSLKWSTYQKYDMERLVLEERARELCFEGKRWFDLMRYNYRHVDGVNYNKILADQSAFVENYDPMLSLVVRKYSSGASSMKVRIPTEPYLYMPINDAEKKVNSKLKQNPVYSTNETTARN
jgi:hypothetical protein